MEGHGSKALWNSDILQTSVLIKFDQDLRDAGVVVRRALDRRTTRLSAMEASHVFSVFSMSEALAM